MITVAILGGGFMAATHAASYRALGERVRVKSVISLPNATAAAVAESVGAELGTDLETAIRDPEIDAVDICLPTVMHRAVAEAAFDAGRHVLLEKPIALTSDDADAIVVSAEQSGRIFMVGFVLRFWPEYVELQRRVAAGELGRPLAVSTSRLTAPVDWNDWMADPAKSGGVPVDLLVHDFDQMNWLLGTPRRVYARAPVPGHVVAVVDYDGAQGVAEGSMAMPRSYPFTSSVRVLGERGVAEYAVEAAPAPTKGNIGANDAPRGLRIHRANATPVSVPPERADPWDREIAHFVECVERGRAPERGTGSQARAALDVSLATVRSLQSGQVVDVE